MRKVAKLSNIHPSYLSQLENDKQPPPGEETTLRLAEVLNEDPDVLLALAGKVSSDLQAIIAHLVCPAIGSNQTAVEGIKFLAGPIIEITNSHTFQVVDVSIHGHAP